MTALEAITKFYGNRKTERSGVPLINHIHEGLTILKELGADQATKDAYCLHPMFQADDDLKNLFGLTSPMLGYQSINLALETLLVMEYRNQANAWLSDKVVWRTPGGTWSKDKMLLCDGQPTPGPLPEVRQMLIADKVQNYKDFLVYHSNTHPRRDELDLYFQSWLKALDISPNEFKRLSDLAARVRANEP